jgi:hypothetical protein
VAVVVNGSGEIVAVVVVASRMMVSERVEASRGESRKRW